MKFIEKIVFVVISLSMLVSCAGGGGGSTSSLSAQSASTYTGLNSSQGVMTDPKGSSSTSQVISSTVPSTSSVSPSSKEVQSAVTSEVVTGSTASQKSSIPATSATASAAPQLSTVSFLVPEGYTLPKIGMKLEELGFCTAAEWIETTQTMDVSAYPLAAAVPASQERCFRLEGYLFPATYTLQPDYTPADILKLMLNHTEKSITQDVRAQISAQGMTVDEAIRLASIIEKEAYGKTVMPTISSVFHNRLNAGQRLESDVTIIYVEGAIKPFISEDVNRYNSYYNTYKCKGLPAGAICNPGIASIKAAANPESTNYYFFVTDSSKQYYFSETYAEHLQTCNQLGLTDDYEE